MKQKTFGVGSSLCEEGLMKNYLTLFFCGVLFLTAGCDQMKLVKNPEVVFETSKGTFVVRLFADKAPVSTKNMLQYVQDHFYEGTVFHRVIANFMIQGGGYTAALVEKPTHAPIRNEAGNGLSNKRGTVAMARTSVIDSATSQFFINVVDNSRLDHQGTDANSYGYAVVGEIIEGLDVVETIRSVPVLCSSSKPGPCTANLPHGMRDVPVDAVVILKAHVR